MVFYAGIRVDRLGLKVSRGKPAASSAGMEHSNKFETKAPELHPGLESVVATQKAGMNAFEMKGLPEVREQLNHLGVL